MQASDAEGWIGPQVAVFVVWWTHFLEGELVDGFGVFAVRLPDQKSRRGQAEHGGFR